MATTSESSLSVVSERARPADCEIFASGGKFSFSRPDDCCTPPPTLSVGLAPRRIRRPPTAQVSTPHAEPARASVQGFLGPGFSGRIRKVHTVLRVPYREERKAASCIAQNQLSSRAPAATRRLSLPPFCFHLPFSVFARSFPTIRDRLTKENTGCTPRPDHRTDTCPGTPACLRQLSTANPYMTWPSLTEAVCESDT